MPLPVQISYRGNTIAGWHDNVPRVGDRLEMKNTYRVTEVIWYLEEETQFVIVKVEKLEDH